MKKKPVMNPTVYTDDTGSYTVRSGQRKYVTQHKEKRAFLERLKQHIHGADYHERLSLRLEYVKAEFMETGDTQLVVLVESIFTKQKKIIAEWTRERENINIHNCEKSDK